MKSDQEKEFVRAERHNEVRRTNRRRLVPRELVCKRCGVKKLSTRRWSLKDDLCRSCYEFSAEGILPENVAEVLELWRKIQDEMEERRLDGCKVHRLRVLLCVSRPTFSECCHWTRARQAVLERLETYPIRTPTVRGLTAGFERLLKRAGLLP